MACHVDAQGLISCGLEHQRLSATGFVLTGSRLSVNEVIWPEKLAHRRLADGVHGARLQVDEHRSRHVLAAAGLVVVNIDPLVLQGGLAVVVTIGIDAVLVGDDFPELQVAERTMRGALL